MSESTDLDDTLLDPSSRFSHPGEVLNAGGLTHEQKIAILRSWTYDESEIAVAEEEGMRGGKPLRVQEAMAALSQLQGGVDTEHTAPDKQHGMQSAPSSSTAP